MRISNFPEHALLGQQHNIVRHPDMPRGVYRLMWETLKAEREFFGVIKNMTADGGFYWFFLPTSPRTVTAAAPSRAISRCGAPCRRAR